MNQSTSQNNIHYDKAEPFVRSVRTQRLAKRSMDAACAASSSMLVLGKRDLGFSACDVSGVFPQQCLLLSS